MELFYASEVSPTRCRLDAEESAHCVRVLRHRTGDELDIIDGTGTLLHCRLVDDSPKGAEAEILGRSPGWNAHPYRLTLGVCPTKNNERYEWFVEKATETGVDTVVPLIGEHSERRVYKPERARKIALAATKQSLKAQIPLIEEPLAVRAYLSSLGAIRPDELRLIACCFDMPSQPRQDIRTLLGGFGGRDITVLIGPEGDFSPEEARLAVAAGFRCISLGPSRLRTETAALTAATAVYLRYL